MAGTKAGNRCIPSGVAASPPATPRRIASTLAGCLILSGCGIVAAGPSEETAYLDKEVIPRIAEWQLESTEIFPFTRFAEARNYEKICLLGQYSLLDRISDELGPIDSYHSTFGATVPENYLALAAVRKGIAHAALVQATKVDIGVVPGKLCVDAEKAVLRRIARPRESMPTALLEARQ